MEKKVIYETERMKEVKKLFGEGGEVRRALLYGFGLAFAGNEYSGLLTISRPYGKGEIPQRDIDRILNSFREAAVAVDRPVLGFRLIEKGTVGRKGGRYRVARYSVYFGEQGRLL